MLSFFKAFNGKSTLARHRMGERRAQFLVQLRRLFPDSE